MAHPPSQLAGRTVCRPRRQELLLGLPALHSSTGRKPLLLASKFASPSTTPSGCTAPATSPTTAAGLDDGRKPMSGRSALQKRPAQTEATLGVWLPSHTDGLGPPQFIVNSNCTFGIWSLRSIDADVRGLVTVGMPLGLQARCLEGSSYPLNFDHPPMLGSQQAFSLWTG